jgi:hypothetical protein
MRKTTIFCALALTVGVAACASMEAQQTQDQLAAAQFTRKQADTPAKLAKLKSLPQYKVTVVVKNGKNYYIYADATQCQCLYVGTETNYQQYQQIRIAQNIVDEQQAAAAMNQEAAMDWDAWGPWGPGFMY